ncbi:hypothetical protein SLA2020_435690 [Shorea laevis]
MMVGKYCVEWLKKAVERMVLLDEDQPFTESSRDGNKAFFAQRGVNRAGCFLELAEYAVGGRKGLIIVLKVAISGVGRGSPRNWVRC